MHKPTKHKCTEATDMWKDFWRYRIIIDIEVRAGFVLLIPLIYYLIVATILTR